MAFAAACGKKDNDGNETTDTRKRNGTQQNKDGWSNGNSNNMTKVTRDVPGTGAVIGEEGWGWR